MSISSDCPLEALYLGLIPLCFNNINKLTNVLSILITLASEVKINSFLKTPSFLFILEVKRRKCTLNIQKLKHIALFKCIYSYL